LPLLPHDLKKDPIPHRCGSVQEYCILNDIKIYFCSICRQVIETDIDPTENIKVTVFLTNDKTKMKEYDKENLEDWA